MTISKRAYVLAAMGVGLVGGVALGSGSAKACDAYPFIGSVCFTADRACDANIYLAANGANVRIQEYQPLYSVIGTLYGGDGSTSFGLPNLQGAEAAGANIESPGPGFFPQGARRGSELTEMQIFHDSLPPAPVAVSMKAAVRSGVSPEPDGGSIPAILNDQTGYQYPIYVSPKDATGQKVELGVVKAEMPGQWQPFFVPTVPPQLATTACIAYKGMYPVHPVHMK